MKKFRSAGSLLMSSLVLVVTGIGCVSTTLPLSSNHPARVDAPSGRVESEPGAILGPDAPLYPSGALAAPVEEDRESEPRSVSNANQPAPDGTREAPYVGRGVIQRISQGQLEIRHGAIPGFMGAMTMAFPVAEEAMDDSLKVGDEIIFRIERHPQHGYQIFSVETVTAESDQAPPNTTGHQQNAPGPTGSSTPSAPQP